MDRWWREIEATYKDASDADNMTARTKVLELAGRGLGVFQDGRQNSPMEEAFWAVLARTAALGVGGTSNAPALAAGYSVDHALNEPHG